MAKRIPELETESKHAVLEEAGVAFDPTTQHVDLSKEEKRRTTALLMAIQAYGNLIIKDAEMYIAISREQSREPDGLRIKPATMEAMVMAAIQFDDFISGKLEQSLNGDPDEQKTTSTSSGN